ncbi:hypothetical protein MesoLjLc_37820 [Mesorhizobium sp. L-8-10]|uniref:hypothetical protein n=1 Tax=Mesorhizobium sp. L-8-10 TaxID=2744523 RepID=UPI001927D15C|nr:hypothetical protein [Mesorhizobium sp. L-8-10]BCH31852.1 hypothetical protein MesoLjLc_37820 [Mesorhizobium sp. L-8-10]
MTKTFFDGRKVFDAEDLRGPRVYSTDLAPSLYNDEDSILVTARALKIKIIAKGLVTLNCAHLVSPLAVRLFEKHPDLFKGEAILPAFRTDKSALADYVEDIESFEKAGIGKSQLEEHIARVGEGVRRVMPWELADVGDRFRELIVTGLSNERSTISQELDRQHGYSQGERDRLAKEIAGLNFGASVHLRDYIAQLSPGVRAPLNRFSTACYHMVGTSVVRCETGMDLNPLSHFKMEDVLLAGQREEPESLTEEAVFLDLFLATALDTVQSAAFPSQIIDSLSFEHAHALSKALREIGFQEKYDQIIQSYLDTAAKTDKREALESIDPVAISTAASELARAFEVAIVAELPNYMTKEATDAKGELYRAGTDLGRDLLGFVPFVGQVVSTAGILVSGYKLTSAAASVYDAKTALAEAHTRRNQRIRAAIDGLKVGASKKAELLSGVAALSDVHTATISRA